MSASHISFSFRVSSSPSYRLMDLLRKTVNCGSVTNYLRYRTQSLSVSHPHHLPHTLTISFTPSPFPSHPHHLLHTLTISFTHSPSPSHPHHLLHTFTISFTHSPSLSSLSQVNEHDMTACTHAEAVAVLKGTKETVKISVAREVLVLLTEESVPAEEEEENEAGEYE